VEVSAYDYPLNRPSNALLPLITGLDLERLHRRDRTADCSHLIPEVQLATLCKHPLTSSLVTVLPRRRRHLYESSMRRLGRSVNISRCLRGASHLCGDIDCPQHSPP